MNCEEFHERYSEYRDERTAADELREFERHLEECETCARYHRVICRGVEVFRDLPSPSPSPDFYDRLKHRIYHLEDGIPGAGSWPTGSAAVLAVAAAGLLALAWVPFVSQVPVEVQLQPVSVERPDAAVERSAERETPSLFQSGPFITTPSRSGDRGWRSDRDRQGSSLLWRDEGSSSMGVSTLGSGSAGLSRGLR